MLLFLSVVAQLSRFAVYDFRKCHRLAHFCRPILIETADLIMSVAYQTDNRDVTGATYYYPIGLKVAFVDLLQIMFNTCFIKSN